MTNTIQTNCGSLLSSTSLIVTSSRQKLLQQASLLSTLHVSWPAGNAESGHKSLKKKKGRTIKGFQNPTNQKKNHPKKPLMICLICKSRISEAQLPHNRNSWTTNKSLAKSTVQQEQKDNPYFKKSHQKRPSQQPPANSTWWGYKPLAYIMHSKW